MQNVRKFVGNFACNFVLSVYTSSAATTNKGSMGAAIQMELARGKQRGERETGKENVVDRKKG